MDKEMDVLERRERLSALARTQDFHRQFHASDAITAIDTLNKMDNLYKQKVEVTDHHIHTFVFVLPDGTKFTPGLDAPRLLKEGKEDSIQEASASRET